MKIFNMENMNRKKLKGSGFNFKMLMSIRIF